MSDLSKIKLNGTVYNFKDAVARTPYYGICSTAKGTVQKTVTISNLEALIDGLSIFVKFSNTNTADNPTLKVNDLDPIAIKRYGTTAASTSLATSWQAGAIVQLVYDGANFLMENWNNSTYTAMTASEMQTGTATTGRSITAARLKEAVEYHAPVKTVNGDTGAVTIDEIQTTAGENNVEYDLIGTAPSNTNSGLVPLYKPTLATFAKTNDFARLTIGSTDTPGVLRIYSSTTNASGYTDLKTGSSSTNTRTITFPDATGTVALTSDIPSVSSWALAANKPSYTFSELTTTPTSLGGYGITDAYTKTEIDGMVSGVLHYKGTKATVSALPSSGNTTGDTWHVTADGSEWAWDGSDWQELGTAVDLSGYVPTSRTVNGKALTSDISLTASDVSALPSNTTYVSSFNGDTGAITYTAPVTSVNGQTGAVTITDNDEKLKTTELDDHDKDYAVLLGLSNATASTKYYDSGIKYRNRDDEYTARLILGVSGTGTGRRTGQIAFYYQDKYCILRKNNTTKSGYYVNLPAAGGTIALTSDIPTTASDVGALADDCAAAGITSTDISNWNAKLSSYTETDPTVPSWAKESSKPTYTASEVGAVAKSGDTMTGQLVVPSGSYSTGGIRFKNNSYNDITLYASGGSHDSAYDTDYPRISFSEASRNVSVLLGGIRAPRNNDDAANKQYVDTAISGISVPQPYNASTNPTGYLRITDLPIYDGTVV